MNEGPFPRDNNNLFTARTEEDGLLSQRSQATQEFNQGEGQEKLDIENVSSKSNIFESRFPSNEFFLGSSTENLLGSVSKLNLFPVAIKRKGDQHTTPDHSPKNDTSSQDHLDTSRLSRMEQFAKNKSKSGDLTLNHETTPTNKSDTESQFKKDGNFKHQKTDLNSRKNSDFTIEHLKVLKKHIEQEKKDLDQELKQYTGTDKKKVEEKQEATTNPKDSDKWARLKKNLLAFTRVKMLNDDLRLWGSSMNIVGLNPREFDHVKKLMADYQVEANHNEKPRTRWLLYPDDPFLTFWTFIYFILLMYTVMVIPYSIAFVDPDDPDGLVITDWIFDGLFMFDMLLTMNTAIETEKGEYISSRKTIIWRYLSGWFFIDFFGVFPFQEFSAGSATGNYNDLAKFFRLGRLGRLVRILRVMRNSNKIKTNKYIQSIKELFQFSSASLRIINFLFVVLISVHFVGCMWFFLSKNEGNGEGTWVYNANLEYADNLTLYITSIYWAVTTLATVGFGDIHPCSDYERIFAICWMIVGVGIYSFTIGALTSILSNQDTREGYLSAKLILMDEFGKDTRLPKELRLKIKRTLEYNSVRNVFNQHERDEFFKEIPIDLKFEISEIMHRGVIHRLSFFKDKDSVFIANIVPMLEPLKVSKGEIIYRTGEYPIQVYFLISGRVNIVVGANMLNLKSYVQGSYFGEIEILANTTRQSTIRAEVDCDMLTLNRKAFLRLMEDFPNYQDELNTIAEERQFRIAEALRKIKKLIPISANSQFWNKKRDHSLYDVDLEPAKQEEHDEKSNEESPPKNFQTRVKSRFAAMKTIADRPSEECSPELKNVEEEPKDHENEQTRSEEKVGKMYSTDFTTDKLMNNKEAKEKIANMINEEELQEEEAKLQSYIGMRNKPGMSPLVRRETILTSKQITEKLQIAEGTPVGRKSVFLVQAPMKNDAGKPDSPNSQPEINTDSPARNRSITTGNIKPVSINPEDLPNGTPLKRKSTLKTESDKETPRRKSFLQSIFNFGTKNEPEKFEKKDEPLDMVDQIDVVEVPISMLGQIRKTLTIVEKDNKGPSDTELDQLRQIEELEMKNRLNEKYGLEKSKDQIMEVSHESSTIGVQPLHIDGANTNHLMPPQALAQGKDSDDEIKDMAKQINIPTEVKSYATSESGAVEKKRKSLETFPEKASEEERKPTPNREKTKTAPYQILVSKVSLKGNENEQGDRRISNEQETTEVPSKTTVADPKVENENGKQSDDVPKTPSSSDSSDDESSEEQNLKKETKSNLEKDVLPQKRRSFRDKTPTPVNTDNAWSIKLNQLKETIKDKIPDPNNSHSKKASEKIHKHRTGLAGEENDEKVKKYKKKIKKLTKAFKAMHGDYKAMQSDIMAIHSKLDAFSALAEGIQSMIEELNSNVSAKPHSAEQLSKTETEVNLKPPQHMIVSNTIYTPDKKTIVFNLQKPIQKTISHSNDDLIEHQINLESPTLKVASSGTITTPSERNALKGLEMKYFNNSNLNSGVPTPRDNITLLNTLGSKPEGESMEMGEEEQNKLIQN